MKKKQKAFFAIFRIITLFIMGLVIAFIIALSQVNLDTLKGDVLFALKEAFGVPIEINGSFSWKLSLRPKIEINKVSVKNADWASHEYAFSADKIDVTLNLISLFRDRPTIQSIKIYDAELCIEKNDKGEYSIPKLSNGTSDVDKNKTPKKYPFEDPGLGEVEIKNIKAHIFNDVYNLNGLQVRYISKNETREYAGWIKTSKKLVPFIVSFSEYNSERKVYPVKAAFATSGDALIANVALEGTSKLPIDFIIKGDVIDVDTLGEVLNLDLSNVPSIYLNIVGGADRKKITFRNSSITIEGNKVYFSGGIDWSKKIPEVNLKLSAETIDLPQSFPQLYISKKQDIDREKNVFKDVPLFGKDIVNYNLNLDITLNDFIVYKKLNIKNLNVLLKTSYGVGRLDIKTNFADSDIVVGADFDLDADGRYYVKFAGTGKNVTVGTILNQIGYDNFISDLPTNVDLYVESHGTNLSELMANMTGPVKVYSVGEGYAYSSLVSRIYGTDFLTTLRHSIQDLFRSDKKYDQMTISCAVVNTKFRKGVAETEEGVAVETNVINLRLAGDLNFVNETMSLSLMTVPVRGLKLSLTGNIVNSIEISGNIAEPDISISGAAVASKVASATGIGLLLTPFTGGIGLVAGAGVGLLAGDLLENWLADDNPCRTALEKGAPSEKDDPAWMNESLDYLIGTILK